MVKNDRMDKNNKIKELLAFIRNGLAFSFSWLVICTMIVSLMSGQESVSVEFLLKIFTLCLWGVITFAICFKNRRILKKGFIFSLTLFYILFIPVEIAMFYFMGIFTSKGNLTFWVIFGAIVVMLYVTSVLVDALVMKKNARVYTEKMNEYISRK